MSKYAPFGAQTFYLGSSISSTASTILLSSFLEPVTGTPYTMALLNTDIVYATIAPKTSSAEFISFTGITQNADGTATLTGVVRGLAKKYPFATDSAYKLPHAGQSILIISDAPQVFNKYVSLEDAETITGLKTFPGGGNASAPVSGVSYSAPTNDLEYASKKYVDSVAIAGAPDAATGTKGIAKLSVAAASATGPIVVGDNDPRVPTAAQVGYIPTSAQKDALAGTGTPSGSNKYVTADTDALKQLLASLATGPSLGTSDVLYPSQNAVKSYVDASVPALTWKNGTATKNLADASTTQNIAHGLGRTPRYVKITVLGVPVTGTSAETQQAISVYNGTTQSSLTHYNEAGIPTIVTTLTLGSGGSSTYQTGVITFDGTNIIITWTKQGSPTGTHTLLWEAF